LSNPQEIATKRESVKTVKRNSFDQYQFEEMIAVDMRLVWNKSLVIQEFIKLYLQINPWILLISEE
jgi:hypothetical protein